VTLTLNFEALKYLGVQVHMPINIFESFIAIAVIVEKLPMTQV